MIVRQLQTISIVDLYWVLKTGLTSVVVETVARELAAQTPREALHVSRELSEALSEALQLSRNALQVLRASMGKEGAGKPDESDEPRANKHKYHSRGAMVGGNGASKVSILRMIYYGLQHPRV